MSGADSALLYDSLKAVEKENEHSKYATFMFSLGRFSETLGSAAGGFVVAFWSMSATFVLSAFVILASLPFALLLREPPGKK